MKYAFYIIFIFISNFLKSQSSAVEVINDAIKITPNERAENMQFGWSIDVQNDFIFVGVPIYSSKINHELGCIFIYKQKDNAFTETHRHTPSILENNRSFGGNVKIHNDLFLASSGGKTTITSANKNNNTVLYGSIDIMTPLNLLEGKSMKISTIVHNDTKKDVGFADEIEVSGAFLITSLPFYPNENLTSGKVVVYEQVKETQFKLFMEIIPPENTTFFGQSVAISGSDVVVGANDEVFIYSISKADSTIKLVTNLKQKNSKNFGGVVAITDNYVFVTNKNSIPPYFGIEIPDTDSIFSMVMINEKGEGHLTLVPNDAIEKKKMAFLMNYSNKRQCLFMIQ